MESIGGLEASKSEHEINRARMDFERMDDLSKGWTATGRRRIGSNRSDGELEMARQAERMMRENPTWSHLRIVYAIGLVEAIEDEGLSKKPEAAALERLRRWRKRLRELGE